MPYSCDEMYGNIYNALTTFGKVLLFAAQINSITSEGHKN